jgi:hypothetical protein
MTAFAYVRELASLPTPRTRLIGREAERGTAHALLLDEAIPLMTLTGPGGVAGAPQASTLGCPVRSLNTMIDP